MAELNNIEDALDPMTDVASALEAQVPSIQEFQDLVFFTVSGEENIENWRNKYGKTIERICVADGATVGFGNDTEVTVVTSLVTSVLSNPSVSGKDGLASGAHDAYNPFKVTNATDTYTRLMKVITTLYFDMYAKGRK